VRFLIWDYEDDRLSFGCEDAEIVAVEAVAACAEDSRCHRETVWKGNWSAPADA
jgi:hypothetical protein